MRPYSRSLTLVSFEAEARWQHRSSLFADFHSFLCWSSWSSLMLMMIKIIIIIMVMIRDVPIIHFGTSSFPYWQLIIISMIINVNVTSPSCWHRHFKDWYHDLNHYSRRHHHYLRQHHHVHHQDDFVGLAGEHLVHNFNHQHNPPDQWSSCWSSS